MQHSQLDRRCRPLSAAEHCCWRGMLAHASFSDDPLTRLVTSQIQNRNLMQDALTRNAPLQIHLLPPSPPHAQQCEMQPHAGGASTEVECGSYQANFILVSKETGDAPTQRTAAPPW